LSILKEKQECHRKGRKKKKYQRGGKEWIENDEPVVVLLLFQYKSSKMSTIFNLFYLWLRLKVIVWC